MCELIASLVIVAGSFWFGYCIGSLLEMKRAMTEYVKQEEAWNRILLDYKSVVNGVIEELTRTNKNP